MQQNQKSGDIELTKEELQQLFKDYGQRLIYEKA